MTDFPATAASAAVARILNPKSLAIIGISPRPGTSGRNLLTNLRQWGYAGDIHLVGRAGGEIDGLAVLGSADELPEGVDLAMMTLPASAVRPTIETCIRRGMGGGIVYASGFAEFGDDGASEQAAISKIARESGFALMGPNCLGFTNYVNPLTTIFLPQDPHGKLPDGTAGALAVLSQSGGLMGMINRGLRARGIDVSYCVSSGNEAVLSLADYLGFLADDPATGGAVIYAEDIRDPQGFLRGVARMRERGKLIVMMHSGRSERGQQAAASHTGALAGDYEVMRTLVTRAGVCVVESLEELLDTAEILARYPTPPAGGVGVVTTSGAFCAISLDTLGDLGVEVPSLSPRTIQTLTDRLPSFMQPSNPLDIGTLTVADPELNHDSVAAVLADDAVSSVVVAVPFTPNNNQVMLEQVTRAASAQAQAQATGQAPSRAKPVVIGLFGDTTPMDPAFRDYATEHGMVVSSSPERMMRAMAAVTRYGQALARPAAATDSGSSAGAVLSPGAQPEWRGKQILAAAGVPVPAGGLARTAGEAVAIADRIGYPVVAKAQAADLQHKTEAGAVILAIAGEDALRQAWDQLTARAAAAGVKALDGILVEEMVSGGVELMTGAKRHPKWGPAVMVGLGGIWVEALGDVRLIPADLSDDEIIAELRALKSAKLLNGFRGSDPVDLAAVARAVAAIGRLMLARPEITELDVNPLLARADGVTALDVLITCEEAQS